VNADGAAWDFPSLEFDISWEEWFRIGVAIIALRVDDLINPVALCYPPAGMGVEPSWVVAGLDGSVVELVHEPGSRADGLEGGFATGLSEALVHAAASIAIDEGGCSLRLEPDGYHRLVGADGTTCVFDPPVGPLANGVPGGLTPKAEALVEVPALKRLMGLADSLPGGEDSEVVRPVMELEVDQGVLAVGMDWRHVARGSRTYRMLARTSGTASTGFYHDLLLRMLHYEPRPLETVPVKLFDPWVCVEGDGWTFWAPQVEIGESAWMGAVHDHLAENGLHGDWLARSALELRGDPQVRVEAFPSDDGPLQVRVSTVLAAGATDDPALRREMDDLAASGLLVWVEEGRVVAAIDVPYERLEGLADEVHRFRSRLTGLDILMSDLAGSRHGTLPGMAEA